MRRITKVILSLSILGYALIMCLTAIFSPRVKESDLKTATVTLVSYRYEVVGHVFKKNGDDIKDIIFTASDGQQYQIARFYKEESESLKGHTVTLRYVENEGSWVGSHAVVELTEGDTVHYTLEEINRSRQNKVLLMPLVLCNVLLFVPLCYVLEDVFGIFGRAKRYRRKARQKDAHREQLAELQNRPRNFPNTIWQTEDGTLTLTVAPNGTVTGSIRINTGDTVKSIPVCFDDTAHTTIRMAEIKAGGKRAPYIEIWEADYDSPTEFTAKPLKTTYFKKGKTVTVRRADENRL